MALTCHYGDFAHPECECYPRRVYIKPLRTESGLKWASIHGIDMAGDLVEEAGTPMTPSVIQSRLLALEAAYRDDFKDFGFKLDGTPTHHFLTNNAADNISGNQIIARSWDQALPTEWANTRSFSVTVEAIINDAQDAIIEFSETTTKIGTGGPFTKTYALWNGTPVKQIITNTTPVRHVQRGYVVTMNGYVNPPAPYWPLEEEQWKRVVEYKSPRRHGPPGQDRYTHYVTSWAYYFVRPTADPTTNFNTWFT